MEDSSAALNRVPVSTIVVEQAHVDRLAEVIADVPGLRRAVVRGGDGAALTVRGLEVIAFTDTPATPSDLDLVDDDASRVGPGDTYGIIFTSGTTGPSKAVVLPHGLPFAYVSPEHTALVDHDDVVLVPFPQFHISGQWTGVLAPLMVGGSAVLVERFSVSGFWNEVRRHGITQTTLLSTMVPFLLGQPERADDATTTLKKVVMGPVSQNAQQFATRFGVQLATCYYGQTEACLPIVSWYGTPAPGTCGWVRDDFEVRIVDGLDQEVEDGEIGELVVRAKEPFLSMSAYAGDPEATVAKWRNLWLHTGDLHRRDADGRHSFVDRSVDAIRRRGENISSIEVEAELVAIDGIALAAVIGVDADGGEQDVKACLVLEPECSRPIEELHARMLNRLPYFMAPRFLEVYDDLPARQPNAYRKPTSAPTSVALDSGMRETTDSKHAAIGEQRLSARQDARWPARAPRLDVRRGDSRLRDGQHSARPPSPCH